MPHVPLRQVRAAIRRRISNDRLVSAELIVEEPDGRELVRAGGVWDPSASCYVRAPEGFEHRPERLRLKRSQVVLMRQLAAWLGQAERHEARDVVAIAGGKPGSGKTFALMIFTALVALKWPGDEQFVSNLNLDNRRECLEALAVIGRPEWWRESDDPRAPYLEWLNGARVNWTSARNPKKLRQRGLRIRHVMVNEAQAQSEELYAVAQTAGRNLGGLCTLAMNGVTSEGGNWTARLWFGIQAGEVKGSTFQMDSADNDAVDHRFIDASGQAVRVAAPRLAGAEIDGIIGMAGNAAYPTFDGRPLNQLEPLEGGHVGELQLEQDIGEPWAVDVTREMTATLMGSARGADVVIGCDFQKHPGCIGVVSRIYRTRDSRIVLYGERVVTTPGQEDAFSQALVDAGYTGNGYRGDGSQGPIALLIGDATGDRQNAAHHRWKPPSYHAMTNNGWVIKPPMPHHRTGVPWNPDVLVSIDQMFVLLERREILFSPLCRRPTPGFPSLVDSFRNALKSYSGKLRKGDVFQHLPDGVRYLAWRFLPRHKAQPVEIKPHLGAYEAQKKHKARDLEI